MSLARKRRSDRVAAADVRGTVYDHVDDDDKLTANVTLFCALQRLLLDQKRGPHRPLLPPHPPPKQPELRREHLVSFAVAALLTGIAFAVRFWRIDHPDEVVFDEVHFGAFAGQYLRREYYFDVHPPFAKMLNALAGWIVGFDGSFAFEQIGDNYTINKVPYVGMRSFCAILGSITIPIIFAIMRESGYPIAIAAFSAALVLFDNGHITQTRLILLDAALVLFMALSLFSYIKFHQQRYREFTFWWWFWLLATGTSLACTLGCKMVGLFTFWTIGAAVLWDLWGLLDIKRGHPIEYVWKHFFYRAIGLILVPFLIYLSFFWVHFKILIYSGPGDAFMSPAFQETLQGNEILNHAREIRYYDTITLMHKDTKQYLHSHSEHYPLRYDDGRISSQGQQVTCYPHNDTNNWWQIIPTKELPDSDRYPPVSHGDVIQLLHVGTNTLLLTHDVASPLMPTNQEFTTVKVEDETRQADTMFQLQINGAKDGDIWKTLAGQFKLLHVPTRVLLWTHPTALPAWAHGQQEVNGNKNAQDRTTSWVVDEIISDGMNADLSERDPPLAEKRVKTRSFIQKFVELQILMLQHNAGLTSDHPYASDPIEWPFCLSGVSFWTQNELQEQIYMIGNLLGWWVCAVATSIFVGIIGADLLARRRGLDPIEDGIRNRLYRNTGFFIGAWAFHYFPFYLMNRQKFLHHYLPAHLASALVAGAVLNFVLVETVNYPISVAGSTTRLRPIVRAKLNSVAWLSLAGILAVVIASWLWISPLTYGLALTNEQVGRRKLLSSWTLHFEPKEKHVDL